MPKRKNVKSVFVEPLPPQPPTNPSPLPARNGAATFLGIVGGMFIGALAMDAVHSPQSYAWIEDLLRTDTLKGLQQAMSTVASIYAAPPPAPAAKKAAKKARPA